VKLGFYGGRLGFFYFGCQIRVEILLFRVEILLFRVEILLFRVEIPDFGFSLFWCLLLGLESKGGLGCFIFLFRPLLIAGPITETSF
jgi:hypothetical protein